MTDTCKLCGTFLNSKTVCPAEEEQCPYHNRKPHFSSPRWRPSKNDIEIATRIISQYRPARLSMHNIRVLEWCARNQLGASVFDCKALNCAEGECDWPLCGCDPYADKVIAALGEQYAPFDTEDPLDYDTLKQFYIGIVGMK